jgi:GNAT superfamily N-acetyltransferase
MQCCEPGSAAGANGPGHRRELERAVTQGGQASIPKGSAGAGVEAAHVRAGRTDALLVWQPPFVERRVHADDRQLGLVDVVHAGGAEQLGKVALAGTGHARLVDRGRIEFVRGTPERAQRRSTTGEVPDTGRDDATGARHAAHLRQTGDGIRHEMDHELSERHVECGVPDGKRLRRSLTDRDTGMTDTDGLDERRRRVDRGHRLGAKPIHELRGQRARAAPHVDRSLAPRDAREVGELRREKAGISAHEAVVGIRRDVEAHDGSLSNRPRPLTPLVPLKHMPRRHLIAELRPIPARELDLAVRPVVEADADALATLMLDAYRDTIDADGSETLEDARTEVAGFFSGSGPPLLDHSLVAVAGDGSLAAAVLVARHDEMPMLGYVMTAADWKRRGIATALVERVMRSLHAAGERRAHLWVTAGNRPAERIYRRLGFRPVRRLASRPSGGVIIGGILAGIEHLVTGRPRQTTQIEEQYREPWASAEGVTVEGLDEPIERPERPDRSGAKL